MWYGIYKEATKTPLTEEQMLQIAIDYEQGARLKELLRKYNISEKTLLNVLETFEVRKRSRSDSIKKINFQEREEIANEVELGETEKDICIKHDIVPETLHRILNELNLKIKNKANPHRQKGIEERIIALYRELGNISQVGKELGVGPEIIKSVLKEKNEPILHNTFTIRPIATEEQYLAISHRYENGEGLYRLCLEYGVNMPDIRRKLIRDKIFDKTKGSWNSREIHLSEEEINEAAEMSTRMPFVDVSRHFGIRDDTLRRILDEYGHFHTPNENVDNISKIRRSEGAKIIPTSEYENVFRLYDSEGLNMTEIAKIYNVTPPTINNIIHHRTLVPVQASFNLRRRRA